MEPTCTAMGPDDDILFCFFCDVRVTPRVFDEVNYINYVWTWVIDRFPNGIYRNARWQPLCEFCHRDMFGQVVSTTSATSSFFFLIKLIAGDVHCRFFLIKLTAGDVQFY